jgi:hypothetical protein
MKTKTVVVKIERACDEHEACVVVMRPHVPNEHRPATK